jgi:hypothetical protein
MRSPPGVTCAPAPNFIFLLPASSIPELVLHWSGFMRAARRRGRRADLASWQRPHALPAINFYLSSIVCAAVVRISTVEGALSLFTVET